jgi:hypothetical protein
MKKLIIEVGKSDTPISSENVAFLLRGIEEEISELRGKISSTNELPVIDEMVIPLMIVWVRLADILRSKNFREARSLKS